MQGRVGILDRRTDFRDVGVFIDQVVRDAHGVEDRLDDAHAVARRIARRGRGIVPEQSDHHADRLAILDRDAADGVDGVEKARVLDERQRALVGIREAGGDADAFVLLAHPDELECRIARNGPQQAAAGHDIGHRKDKLDAALFDRGDDRRAFELNRIISRRQQIRVHARSPRRCGETSAPVPKRKSQIPATGLPPSHRTAACGSAATPASLILMSIPRRLAAALVLAIAGSSIGAASAADWPTRPLRIIAPSTPGGAADLFGRLLCDHFSEAFHERCFVENRAGAGGLIGMSAESQATPDGYTLATSSIAYNVIAPAISPNPGFDPMKNFTHIAYIGGPPNVLVVNPAFNVHSLAELVALGRRRAAIDYVSPGVGTLGHLVAEVFAQKAGIKLQQIMTKGGSQAMMDLISGNVNVGTMTWTSALAQIRAGKVIPIAVTANARLAEFPDLPTFKDLGYDELTAVTWFALSGPAGLPNDVTQRLNAAVAKMLALPDVRKRLDRDAVETRVMTSDQFTAFMASEIDKWTPIARRLIPGN